MPTFEKEFFNLGHLDTLSYGETFMHRLDPRVKVLATFGFLIAVVSFPKYSITGLLPFFLFPAVFMAMGDAPFALVARKVLLVSPFAVFVGIFNPLIDRQASSLFGMPLAAGWISFISIMLKFMLTISATILLIATTSFPGICSALGRLGLPQVFVSQLLFLYRYLFVLMEETMRLLRARDMRSFGGRGRDIKTFVVLAGTLFVRTVERSERIYRSMLSRGFDGEVRTAGGYRITITDLFFAALSFAAFFCFRRYDIPVLLGRLLIGLAGGGGA